MQARVPAPIHHLPRGHDDDRPIGDRDDPVLDREDEVGERGEPGLGPVSPANTCWDLLSGSRKGCARSASLSRNAMAQRYRGCRQRQ